MRKVILSLSVFFIVFIQLSAQTILPNMTLEEWVEFPFSTGSYEEPGGGIWTTANRAVLLNPDIFKITTFKTEDAHQGIYAAKIITDLADLPGPNDILQTGTLATGYFDELALPPTNLKDGVPFNGRPYRFKGYYKYFSVNHDSCDIYSLLYKWNSSKQRRDTIAYAWLTDTVRVTTWTQFDIPYHYYSEGEPDTISIIFAPSAAGDLFEGQVGSTLYIDDISLEFENGIEMMLMSEVVSKAYPNPVTDVVTIELTEEIGEGYVILHSFQGKECLRKGFTGNIATIHVAGFPPGYYYYQIVDTRSIVSGGTFIVSER